MKPFKQFHKAMIAAYAYAGNTWRFPKGEKRKVMRMTTFFIASEMIAGELTRDELEGFIDTLAERVGAVRR